jgi:hypothetical protein
MRCATLNGCHALWCHPYDTSQATCNRAHQRMKPEVSVNVEYLRFNMP